MLLEAETNKYCPGGYDIGAISNLITWVLNFFFSALKLRQQITHSAILIVLMISEKTSIDLGLLYLPLCPEEYTVY
jgi:hypothetical protein